MTYEEFMMSGGGTRCRSDAGFRAGTSDFQGDDTLITDHRSYYCRGRIETIDAIESACTGLTGYEGFLAGTCLKYLFRWRWKGAPLADLKKARYYLDRLIAQEEQGLDIGHAESMPERFEQDKSAMSEDTK